MEASPQPEGFIAAGLAAMGIDVDEVDLAVMGAMHQLFWPAVLELLAFDAGDGEIELCPDPSRAP